MRLELGGHVAINKCKVIDEPADSPKRLKDEFEQYVETEKGEWKSFIVGPTQPRLRAARSDLAVPR